MGSHYFDTDELKDFANIDEYATEQGEAFFNYYNLATEAGALTKREKALIALAVATAESCPYCIDAYTNSCLSLGVSKEEMMESVHVAAAMKAGITLAHSTQMRGIVRKKSM